jgi:hypothetical protein
MPWSPTKRLKDRVHWQCLYEITPKTVTCDRDRVIYIFCCPAQGGQGKYCRVSLSQTSLDSMFVEIKVRYSALFTNLVGWHAGAFSFPLSDVILAQLVCPLSDITFCLHSGITNPCLYKH